MSAGSHGIDEKILGSAKILVEKLDGMPSKYDIIHEVCNKIPKVVLPKIDISPYLFQSTPHPSGNTPKEFQLRECIVNVADDDLTELKATLTANLKAYRMIADAGHHNLKSCKVCYEIFTSVDKLQKHLHYKHMIRQKPLEGRTNNKRVSFSNNVVVFESVPYHRCRKCAATFNNYKDLRVHVNTNHRNRKCYVCTYCTKVLANRKLFKTHVKLHCNLCGTLTTDTHDYLEHKRSSCGKSRTKGNVASNVTSDVTNTPELYSCVLCRQQFKLKCILRHHVSFLHENIKPTKLYESKHLGNDKLYLCKFCGESSVDRDRIEKHIAMLPDLRERPIKEVSYACSHCTRRFESERELTQHIWSHFLNVAEATTSYPPSSPVPSICTDNPRLFKLLNKQNDRDFHVSNAVQRSMQPIVLVDRLQDVEKYFDKLYGFKGKERKIKSTVRVGSDYGKDVNIENGSKNIIIKKRTMYSKHQCNMCMKYYSSKYSLRRHKEAMHVDLENLRCRDCEEVFFWPSLLLSHKCLRWSNTDVDYGDSRPDVHFTNMLLVTPGGSHNSLEQQMKDLTITEDYANDEDFEMPAPIVELTEYDDESYQFSNSGTIVRNKSPTVQRPDDVIEPDSALPRPDSALLRPDSVLPRLDSVLPTANTVVMTPNSVLTGPRPDSVLPRMDYLLRRPDSVLPGPGYVSPMPGNMLQRSDSVLPRQGYVLQMPGYRLPRQGYVLPRPGMLILHRSDSVIPRPGYVLPRPGYVLPRPGYVLPRPGYVLPRPGYVLPRPGYVLPRLNTGLPPNATLGDSIASKLPLNGYRIVMEEVPLEFV